MDFNFDWTLIREIRENFVPQKFYCYTYDSALCHGITTTTHRNVLAPCLLKIDDTTEKWNPSVHVLPLPDHYAINTQSIEDSTL